MANENNVFVDKGQSSWSDLWKKEDYWAIWFGFTLLIFALWIFLYNVPESYEKTIDTTNIILEQEAQKAPFKTIAYIEAQNIKKGISGEKLPLAQVIKKLLKQPVGWNNNLLTSFYLNEEESTLINDGKKKVTNAKIKLTQTYQEAQEAESKAASDDYKNTELNKNAELAITAWQKANADYKKISQKISPYNIFMTLPLLCILFIVLFGTGIFLWIKAF